MADALPDPVKVSPLIRGGRYIAFFLGVFYGISKRKVFQTLEAHRHDHEKVLHDQKAASLNKEKHGK